MEKELSARKSFSSLSLHFSCHGKFDSQQPWLGGLVMASHETLTVSKAILRAGGFSNFANQRKVKLTRAGPDGQTDTRIIDVKEIIERGRLDLDVEIRPNDFIVVPERLINF